MHNTKNPMFIGSNLEIIFFLPLCNSCSRPRPPHLRGFMITKWNVIAIKRKQLLTCTKQIYYQYEVLYGSKPFNLLILIQASSTNKCVGLLPKEISRFLHLEEDSLGLFKTLGVYNNPCKCDLVHTEKARCSSKTRLRSTNGILCLKH